MLYTKEQLCLEEIQMQFDTIINLMHTRFMFEESGKKDLEAKYDLLVDASIVLLNNNLMQISFNNSLPTIIKYELDKDDECPFEFEQRPNLKISPLEEWFNTKYNIYFEGNARLY